MNAYRNCLWLVIVSALLLNCNTKKKPSLAGEDPVEIGDFIEFFPEVSPPYAFADTTLAKKDNDSLLISYKIFTQFVPDTVMQHFFGKTAKPKLYPLARMKGAGGETYLFAKGVSGDKRSGLLFAFSKQDGYLDGMELLKPDKLSSTRQVASVDKGFSFYHTITRRNSDGTSNEGKDVYGLSKSTGKFDLVMTDALDKVTELINPIDTFSRKAKYTADYGSGKSNLVSIRDGRKKDRLTFFIHFEKNDGACVGELKGEAIIKSPTTAEYRQPGDPCALRFTFSSTAVTLKEIEGCGAHRGLRCSFDGSFARKKDNKQAKK